jgi:hypothetical protein
MLCPYCTPGVLIPVYQYSYFRLKLAQEIRERLIEKMKMATDGELSAEERAAAMEEILLEEEKIQKEIDTDLKRLHDIQFRKTQDLYDARAKETNMDAEIQGSRAAIRNLNSKIGKVDHDSLKQQEIIYNQDFAIQQLERQINRMQGERSNEEKIQLEAKIRELTEELDSKNSIFALLDIQLMHTIIMISSLRKSPIPINRARISLRHSRQLP